MDPELAHQLALLRLTELHREARRRRLVRQVRRPVPELAAAFGDRLR